MSINKPLKAITLSLLLGSAITLSGCSKVKPDMSPDKVKGNIEKLVKEPNNKSSYQPAVDELVADLGYCSDEAKASGDAKAYFAKNTTCTALVQSLMMLSSAPDFTKTEAGKYLNEKVQKEMSNLMSMH